MRTLLAIVCLSSMACGGSKVAPEGNPAPDADSIETAAGEDSAITAPIDAAPEAADTGPSEDLGPIPGTDLAGCTLDPGAPLATAEGFTFTFADATVGFPKGDGRWVARFHFGYGFEPAPTVVCVLDPVRAPISVTRFIGLARGQKKYRNASTAPYGFGKYYEPLDQGDSSRVEGVLAAFGTPYADLSPGFWNLQEAKDAPKRAGPLIAQVAHSVSSGGPGPGSTTVGALVFAVEDNIDPAATRMGACDVAAVKELTTKDHMRIAKVEIARCP